MRRLAILLLTAAIAPGTWLRSAVPTEDHRPILTIHPLPLPQGRAGALAIKGAWVLSSPNTDFGSYSALLALPDGRLLAASDRGRFLRFAPPGTAPMQPEFGVIGGADTADKRAVDAEALTADAARAHLWVAYEGRNTIARYDPALAHGEAVAPAAMHGWPSNSGPETLERLADGRFLVIAEGRPAWRPGPRAALLFPGDPLDGGEPVAFRYAPPEGYRAVDAANLPDGRVLILHRKVVLGLPFGFATLIAVADPHEIEAGTTWRGRVIGGIAEPLPSDNFEGMATVPQADGTVRVWLISDDNNAALQRTLLYELKLELRPAQAKGRADRSARPLARFG